MENIISRLGFFAVKIHIFLFINLFFILGIIFESQNLTILSINFFFIILFTYFISKKLYRDINDINFIKIILLLASFLLGAILYKEQIYSFYKFKNSTNNKKFDVIGSIKDISRSQKKIQTCLVLKIEAIKEKDDKKWNHINNQIQLYVPNSYDIKIDDKIKIYNINFQFSKNKTYEKYLIKEDLYASLFLNRFYFKLISRPKFSINQYLHEFKEKIINTLKSKFSPETFALFSSIFLGNKTLIKNDIEKLKDLFKIWGLSHYLARSGLHLVIIISIWFFLMSLIKINFKVKNFILFFVIILYHLLTWKSVPFIRSLIMFIFYKICIFFDLQANTLHLLNLTCLIMLLINPIQIFFIDFQLSFALTYALVWLSQTSLRKQIVY